MNPAPILYTAAAAAALGGALVVALSGSVFRAVMGLLLSLAGVAGIFFVLGAPLLGALQMILYAGGVLVLFLFAIFVTPSDLGGAFRPTRAAFVLGALAAAATGGLLLAAVAWHAWPRGTQGEVAVEAVGRAFVGEYLIPFEAVSLLLLAAMVAAVVVVRKEIRS